MTIKAVIAWRLTVMTLLGRDTPALPPDTLFSDTEIAALGDFATDRRLAPPDNLGRAVLTTARLGGYLNRKHDLAPRERGDLGRLHAPRDHHPVLRAAPALGSDQ